MSDTEPTPTSIWIQPMSPSVGGSSLINLANLLLRETSTRITTLQRCEGSDPELFVVSRLEWRDSDPRKPVLPQMPGILSLLETLRESKGVPHEIYLDSNDGIAVYLPTGTRISDLPRDSKEAIRILMALARDTVANVLSTMHEVENCFWVAARRKGFSPEIVQRMALKEQHYDSPGILREFHGILRKYFSIRFHIQRSESCLYVEEED